MKKTLILCAAMFTLATMTACKSGTAEDAVVEPPFEDTIPIIFETDWMYRYGNGIYCSMEINGVKIDTVLIDNGCYHSDISPDLAEKLNMSYKALRVDTILEGTCCGKTISDERK
nr:hypothetical protein [Bacteroidales bacterium]